MARYKKKDIDLDRVMQMRAQGLTIKDIAKEIGCSTQSLNEKMREAGLTRPYSNNLDTGKIIALHRAKRTPQWIARDMGIRPEAVIKVIMDYEKGA